jgi:hypothetical protein
MFFLLECSTNRFGFECETPCNCLANNTITQSQSCDHVNGTCYCSPFWTGTQCEVDIDECTFNIDSCTGENEGCHNIEGGFMCSCLVGYIRDNVTKTCVNGTFIYLIANNPKLMFFKVMLIYQFISLALVNLLLKSIFEETSKVIHFNLDNIMTGFPR